MSILMILEHVRVRVIKPPVDFGGSNQTGVILEVLLSTEENTLSFLSIGQNKRTVELGDH